MRQKSYTPDGKTKIALEMLKEEITLNELSSIHGVNQIRQWKYIVNFNDKRKNEEGKNIWIVGRGLVRGILE
jgi:hypothetical protein